MVAQYGGLGGVRDESMVESALAKPRNRFAYENVSISELAASYAAGIVHNRVSRWQQANRLYARCDFLGDKRLAVRRQ